MDEREIQPGCISGLDPAPRRPAARYAEPVPLWLKEWREILSRPWPEIACLLTEQSENAARLRQSTPFAGVLTKTERRRMYEAFRV